MLNYTELVLNKEYFVKVGKGLKLRRYTLENITPHVVSFWNGKSSEHYDRNDVVIVSEVNEKG